MRVRKSGAREVMRIVPISVQHLMAQRVLHVVQQLLRPSLALRTAALQMREPQVAQQRRICAAILLKHMVCQIDGEHRTPGLQSHSCLIWLRRYANGSGQGQSLVRPVGQLVIFWLSSMHQTEIHQTEGELATIPHLHYETSKTDDCLIGRAIPIPDIAERP